MKRRDVLIDALNSEFISVNAMRGLGISQRWLFYMLVAGGLLLGPSRALGAVYRNDAYTTPSPAQPTDRLRHEVNNQAEEIRVLYARVATQESLIESLRDDIHKLSRSSTEAHQSDAKQAQARISDLELKVDALEKQLSKTNDLLSHSQRKLDVLDTSLDQQNKNSKHLEKSLGTLLEAVGAESSSSKGDIAGADTYRVVAGDSLEKIARRYKTSVKVLKDLNGLDGDRIVVGKKMKVPVASP